MDTKLLTFIIIAVSLLPVAISMIADANFSGSTLIIMTLVPLFIALGVLKKVTGGHK